MLIATLIVSTLAVLRRRRGRRRGAAVIDSPDQATRSTERHREWRARSRALLRRRVPVLAGAAVMTFAGVGGGVLLQC
ncbi:hypothetical protein ACFVMC_24110 [Nocardia sp. NPDC127579]|uniref:hypothetical protein n=1 Tax=Nocardia sp. NPDC127579 TaxID=3345402 RepID=UPI003632A840